MAGQDAAFGARLAAASISRDMAVLRSTVTQAAANPGIARGFADPKGCTLSFALSGEQGRLDLIGRDGSTVCSSRAGQVGGRGYRGVAWLPRALRGPVFAAPVPDPATGRPTVLVTAPVPGLGLLAGLIDLGAAGPALSAQFGGPRQLEFLLTTADGGTILTRSLDPARFAGRPVDATPFGRAAEGLERPDVAGVLRLYTRSDVAGAGWRVYAGADRAAALAAAQRLARRQLLIIAGGLVLGLIAAVVVHRRITRPMRQLGQAVRVAAAAAGTAAQAGPVAVSGPAEVVGLAEDVNSLVAAVGHELAERRRAEQAAREMERTYRRLFDSNPIPMCVFDHQTLAFLEVNDAAVAHYGYSREEFACLRVPDLRLATPDSPAAGDGAAADAADRGGPARHVKKDGSVIEINMTSHQLSFQGHDAWCGVIEDLTQREHLERRLRQSQRLESLGQLAGGVAHDFNNLLSVILGYSAFAAEEVDAAAQTDPRWQPVSEDLGQVLREVDRATKLTRQLLSFARQDVVQTRAVNLNTVVTDIERMLRRTLGGTSSCTPRSARTWPSCRPTAGSSSRCWSTWPSTPGTR